MNLHTYSRWETRILIGLVVILTIYAMLRIETIVTFEDGKLDDPMKSSGYLTAIFGIWLSLFLERMFARLTRQIEHDGTIPWGLPNSERMLRQRLVWSFSVASAVALTIFGGFVIFHFGGLPNSLLAWEFLLSAMLLGAIAGHRLGAGAAYGQIGRLAAQPDTRLRLILGHADNFAGSRRLGEFIAYQGVLISIPIGWLAVWIALEREGGIYHENYGQWIIPHLALTAIALFISWFNFIQPLLLFSAKYRTQKEPALLKWRDISRSELIAAQRALKFAGTVDGADRSLDEISRITRFSERLFALPEVPLRASVTGLFSVATLFPVATFVLDLLLRNTDLGKVLTPLLSMMAGIFVR